MTTGGQDADDATPTLPGSLTVGDGWFLQIRPRERDSVRLDPGPGPDGPGLVKQSSGEPCRLGRAIPVDAGGRSPGLTVRARCGSGLVEWVAICVQKPDGGLKRLIRGELAPGAPPGEVVARIAAAEIDPWRPAFLVLQLAAAGEGRLDGLRIDVLDPTAPATPDSPAVRFRASPFRVLFDPVFYAGQAGEALGDEEPFAHYKRTRGLLGFDPHPLFDTAWYLGQLTAPLPKRESPLAHYWRVGDRLGLRPHPLFDPVAYRAQSPVLAEDGNTLWHFLQNGQHEPRRPNPSFAPDLYTEQNPEILISGINPLVDYISKGQPDQTGGEPRRIAPESRDLRIVVYTCLFGQFESLKTIAAPSADIRYLAFTDRSDLESDHWEVVRLTDGLAGARRSSRLPKILAHLYLPDHDVSVYVDASFEITSDDIRTAVADGLEGRDLGLYRHHKRRCVYDELDLCIGSNIENADRREAYLSIYERTGIPRQAGLFENGVIFRRNTPEIASLNESWWRHHLGARDQLSFMPALIGSGVRVNPIRQGDQVRRNDHFRHVRHDRVPLPAPGKLYGFVVPGSDFEGLLASPAVRAIMARLDPDDGVLFLQEGYGFAASDWPSLAMDLAAGSGGSLVVGRSDTARASFQRLPPLVGPDDPQRLRALADAIADVERDWQVDVSALAPSLAPALLVPARLWSSSDQAGSCAPSNAMPPPVRMALSLTACKRLLPAEAGPASPDRRVTADRPVLVCILHQGAGLTRSHYNDRFSGDFDLTFTEGDFGEAGDVVRGDFGESLTGIRRIACCTFGGAGEPEEAEHLVEALAQAGHAVTWLAVADALPDSSSRTFGPSVYADPAGMAAAIRRQDAVFPFDLILATGPGDLPRDLVEAADDLAIPVRYGSALSGTAHPAESPSSLKTVAAAVTAFRFADRANRRPRPGIGGVSGVIQSSRPADR